MVVVGTRPVKVVVSPKGEAQGAQRAAGAKVPARRNVRWLLKCSCRVRRGAGRLSSARADTPRVPVRASGSIRPRLLDTTTATAAEQTHRHRDWRFQPPESASSCRIAAPRDAGGLHHLPPARRRL